MKSVNKRFDIENESNQYLRQLQPIPLEEQDQISEKRKAELRMETMASLPVTGPGVGLVGPTEINEDPTPSSALDIITPSPPPVQEEVPEEKPHYDLSALREMNGLDYPITPEIGAVFLNRYERFDPTTESYIGTETKRDTIQIQLRVNKTQLINGRTSYMKLHLDVENPAGNLYFGDGSVTNLIKSVTVKLSNGQVLDVHNETGLYNHINDAWNKTDYFNTGLHTLKGYGQDTPTNLTNGYFYIFMPDLIKIFGSESLLMPDVVNMMDVIIELQKPSIAFKKINPLVAVDVLAIKYTISDISFNFDSYYIDNDVFKTMLMKPYIVEYPTYETIRKLQIGSKFNVDLDISKARILKVYARQRTEINDIETNLALETIGSEYEERDYNLQYPRWQLNNTQYPAYNISRDEEYIHNYKTIRQLEDNISKLSLGKFKGTDYCSMLDLVRSKYMLEGTEIDHTNIIKFSIDTVDNQEDDFLFNFVVVYVKRLEVKPSSFFADSNNEFATFKITE